MIIVPNSIKKFTNLLVVLSFLIPQGVTMAAPAPIAPEQKPGQPVVHEGKKDNPDLARHMQEVENIQNETSSPLRRAAERVVVNPQVIYIAGTQEARDAQIDGLHVQTEVAFKLVKSVPACNPQCTGKLEFAYFSNADVLLGSKIEEYSGSTLGSPGKVTWKNALSQIIQTIEVITLKRATRFFGENILSKMDPRLVANFPGAAAEFSQRFQSAAASAISIKLIQNADGSVALDLVKENANGKTTGQIVNVQSGMIFFSFYQKNNSTPLLAVKPEDKIIGLKSGTDSNATSAMVILPGGMPKAQITAIFRAQGITQYSSTGEGGIFNNWIFVLPKNRKVYDTLLGLAKNAVVMRVMPLSDH